MDSFTLDNKRIIFHIGYKKCASTFLQKSVFPNLKNVCDLANRATLTDCHYIMAEDFEPARFKEIIISNTVNRDDDCGYLLVSWEDFVQTFRYTTKIGVFKGDSRNSLSATRFETILGNLYRTFPTARIVMIIREQRSFLLSYFCFNIQSSYWNTEDLDEVCDLFNTTFSQYDEVFQRYADKFGPGNVQVVPFELVKEDPARFVNTVLRFTGLTYDREIPTKKVNISSKRIVDTFPKMYVNKLINLLTPFGLLIRFEHVTIGKRGVPRLVRNVLLDPMASLFRFLLSPVLRLYFTVRYSADAECAIAAPQLALITPVIRKSNQRLREFTGQDLSKYGYLYPEE